MNDPIMSPLESFDVVWPLSERTGERSVFWLCTREREKEKERKNQDVWKSQVCFFTERKKKREGE